MPSGWGSIFGNLPHVPPDRRYLPTSYQTAMPEGTPSPWEQEGRQIANPFAIQNPDPYGEQSAWKSLAEAMDAQRNQPRYEPPPPFMLPKIPGWALLALAGLGALDPTKTVVPSAVSGLMQGGQMASQNEAVRRQEAVEGARAAGELDIRKAQMALQRASGMASQARDDERFKAEQSGLTERTKIAAGSREKVADINAGVRDIPALLATVRDENAPGAARASAAIALRAIDRDRYPFEDADIAALRAHTPKQVKDVAGATNLEEKTKDIKETREGRIKVLLSTAKGKDARTEFDKSRTEYQNIVNKHLPAKQQSELRETNSKITANLARANNSLAAAAKSRATSGAKPPTEAQIRYQEKELRKAEEAIAELESSKAYLDSMEAVHKQQAASTDPALAQAGQQALGELNAQRAYLTDKLKRANDAFNKVKSQYLPKPMSTLNTGTPPRAINLPKGQIGYGMQNEGKGR